MKIIDKFFDWFVDWSDRRPYFSMVVLVLIILGAIAMQVALHVLSN